MPIYIMLTRLSPDALRSPRSLETLENKVEEKIRVEVPSLEWIGNYAVCGPYDYVDIFKALDNETAMKVSAIVRTFGHAQTEIWPASEWDDFAAMARDLPT